MEKFSFEKGGDVLITLDSQVLGGIKKAVCSTGNSFVDIGSFLDEAPVYRIAEASYAVTLEMDLESVAAFEHQTAFDELMIRDNAHTVKYLDCSVDSIQLTVDAKNALGCEVKISAEERDVI